LMLSYTHNDNANFIKHFRYFLMTHLPFPLLNGI
jgi:hypothetical protein